MRWTLQRHPVFPTSSVIRGKWAQTLGRNASRGIKSRLLFDNLILFRRPCESRDYNHRCSMREKVSATAPKTRGHGVWVPAFAGTTSGYEWAYRHCEERSDEAIHLSLRLDGLLRGACHPARIRATRWLAMTG